MSLVSLDYVLVLGSFPKKLVFESRVCDSGIKKFKWLTLTGADEVFDSLVGREYLTHSHWVREVFDSLEGGSI